MDINIQYASILQEILEKGHRVTNKRTGKEVCELPGITFKNDNERDGFPLLSLRKISVKNFVAEQMWFLAGKTNIHDFLSEHTKIWDSFAEEDGWVSSAYGYRWRKMFLVDQIEEVLAKLKNDPTTRHSVVMMWNAETDLTIPQKNVPCPVMFTLMIMDNKLHMHVIMRSNDMILGFPTDVAGFSFLQMILAQELNVGIGTYTHSISNAHIYSDHYAAAQSMIARERLHDQFEPIHFTLSKDAYKDACDLKEEFFEESKARIEKFYDPLPAISGLVIAL